MQFSTALRNARAGQIGTTVGSGGTMKIYTGSAPGVGNSATGTLLATLTALVWSSGTGIETFTATADPDAAATGTPGYYRIATSGGTVVIEGPAAVGSGEANFGTTITLHGVVSLTSATITEGNA